MALPKKLDAKRRQFIIDNFAAALHEEREDNRRLGYDKTNNFIIRDWQALVRDAIYTLDYAFDKIEDIY